MFIHTKQRMGWRPCEAHRPCRGWRPRHPVNAKRSNKSSQIYKCSPIYKNVGDGVLVNRTDHVGDGVPDIPQTRSVQTRYHRLSMFTHIWKCRGWRSCKSYRPCRGWRPRHPVNAKRSNKSSQIYKCSFIYKNVWDGVLAKHTDHVGDGVPDIPWTRSVQTRTQIYKCSPIYKNVGDGVPDIPQTRSVQTRYHRLSMFTHIWKCMGWCFCETHRPCRGWRPRHPANAKRSNTLPPFINVHPYMKMYGMAFLWNTPTV